MEVQRGLLRTWKRAPLAPGMLCPSASPPIHIHPCPPSPTLAFSSVCTALCSLDVLSLSRDRHASKKENFAPIVPSTSKEDRDESEEHD